MRHLSVFLATGLLAISGCAQGPQTQPTSPSPAASQPPSQAASSPSAGQIAGTPIRVLDFTLQPMALALAASTVSLAVTNDGPTVHNVTIRDSSGSLVAGTADLREGESETITTQIAPGTYDLICTLPGHESLGIKGSLTVTAP